MFARFPHLPLQPDANEADIAGARRLDWQALIARLEAERDLRGSLDGGLGSRGFATMMAEGSFDPRAAEMIFALAAGVSVSGDLPERQVAAENLVDAVRGITGGTARLRNAKPSDCNNPSQTTDPCTRESVGVSAPPSAESPLGGNVSRTE